MDRQIDEQIDRYIDTQVRLDKILQCKPLYGVRQENGGSEGG